MSHCDEIFIKRCEEIISANDRVPCRAKWPDGTPSETLHITNVVDEYDLSEEFPIMTIRKVGLKSAVKELLWIYQQKSNKIADLGLHIWDQWQDENGTIGKAYGYQIAQKYCHHIMKDDPLSSDVIGDLLKTYPSASLNCIERGKTEVWLDQMDGVLWDLRNDDHSRRIMTSTYNFADLHEMGLYPCAFMTMWTVTGNKLNLMLVQRSQDMLAANAWNVMQYAALLVMVANATGHIPGKLTHVIGDCHIYDRHIPIVKELITRKAFMAPCVEFTNTSKDFYSYSQDDFKFTTTYNNSGDVDKFEVAI